MSERELKIALLMCAAVASGRIPPQRDSHDVPTITPPGFARASSHASPAHKQPVCVDRDRHARVCRYPLGDGDVMSERITICPGRVPGLDHITCSPEEAQKLIHEAEFVALKFKLGLKDSKRSQFITPLTASDAIELMRQAMREMPEVELLRDSIDHRLYIIAA